MLCADVTTFIVDDPFKRMNNMTMAWGLEARVRFLDHKLVELAAQMPTELKLRDGGKYVLKQIARGALVPDSVIAQPEAHLTRIQGSKLWHMAALEMWLQSVKV